MRKSFGALAHFIEQVAKIEMGQGIISIDFQRLPVLTLCFSEVASIEVYSSQVHQRSSGSWIDLRRIAVSRDDLFKRCAGVFELESLFEPAFRLLTTFVLTRSLCPGFPHG